VEVIDGEHIAIIDERTRLSRAAREAQVRVGKVACDRAGREPRLAIVLGALADELGAADGIALLARPRECAAQRGRADRGAGEPRAPADAADDERDRERAIAELSQANEQDPRALYELAAAYAAAGDAAKAKATAAKVVDFNALSFNLGYMRGKAKALAK